MENLGQPFVIQNTSEGWQITWTDAVKHGTELETKERVSFTVLVPRRANLTIEEVQTFAVKRAMELLQVLASKGKDAP
jgi:hypothetical protein